MKIAELVKLLKQNGIVFVEHGKRHDMYYSPITKKAFPVPRHGSQDVGEKLLNAILKQAGLKESRLL